MKAVQEAAVHHATSLLAKPSSKPSSKLAARQQASGHRSTTHLEQDRQAGVGLEPRKELPGQLLVKQV